MKLNDIDNSNEPIELEIEGEWGRSVGDDIFVSDEDISRVLKVKPKSITDEELVEMTRDVVEYLQEHYEEALKFAYSELLARRSA